MAVEIPARFCGPAGSGNGGYVCGRVAAYVDGPAAVTLRRPPPLDAELAVDLDSDGGVRVRDGATLVAEARPAPAAPPLASPGAVSLADIRSAGRARYFQDPVFPLCFVCGPARQAGDGLRIFAGRLPGRDLWAAPWTPDQSVAGAGGRVPAEIVWAALDCPGGIAAAEAAALDTPIVLGRMTARLAGRPGIGWPCAVVAWPGARTGRKHTAFSALLGPGGEVLAAARAVWLALPSPAGAS
jgi:hypothetical protein